MLWRDGHLLADTTVPFDLSDRGLLLGDGVFDTSLALNGRIAFEDAHVARLEGAGNALGFPVDGDAVRHAMRSLAATGERSAIRVTVSRGPGRRGLAPPEFAQPGLWASASPINEGFIGAPLSLRLTEIRRNETSPTSRLKTLGYLDAVLAAAEAKREGCDDGLFLNTKGDITCAGAANVFAIVDDEIWTPPLADGVLNGIMRARVLALAPSLGLIAAERSFTLETLNRAEAVFLTNSLRLLSPVTRIGASHIRSAGHKGVLLLKRALMSDAANECGATSDALQCDISDIA